MIILRKYRESFHLPETESKEAWDITWDVNGYEKARDMFGALTRKEWNQTIITKINQLSASIHQRSLIGGANVLEVGTNLEWIFDDLEYYDSIEKKLGGRFDVIFKPELQSIVRVYNRDREDLTMIVKTNVPEEYYDDKRRRLLLLK